MADNDTTQQPMGSVVIEANSIVKRFGGVAAVDGVSFDARRGEIHGLVGENGAGKSTLMRVLSGILTPDSGEVRIEGTPLVGGAGGALDAGVALVHQELSLVPEMTVAENIMLGSFPTRAGFTRRAEMKQVARDALAEIHVSVDLDEPVVRLSVALRQFVEIARAVARQPRVLILDEPTATLTPTETDYLFDTLRRLASNGLAIIYISHRIPEIYAICDRVTVMRDGKHVETTAITDIQPEQVVDKMVGRELKKDLKSHRQQTAPGEVVLSAKGVTAARVHGVDLDVRASQIVGLGGLVGAGRTELVRAILGADVRSAGDVTLMSGGKTRRLAGYRSAVASGAAYVPEERRTDGLALTMTVSDNVALPNRHFLAQATLLQMRKVATYAKDLATAVGLRPPEIQREAGAFSGGNQQKVVLAKWLGREPDLIVLDEPTRGVDVGAKVEIHRLVKELADNGAAVLVVSSDLPELLEISDVIHVMRDGRIVGTLAAGEADQKTVMSLASGESTVSAS